MRETAIVGQQLPDSSPSRRPQAAPRAARYHRLFRINHLTFAAAMLLVPFVFRGSLSWENDIRLRNADWQGIYVDTCVTTVFVATCVLVGSLTRMGVFVLVTLWCTVHYANYENVRALGALIQVENAFHLGDATFLGGSALAFSRPGLLIFLLCMAWLATWWTLKYRRLDRQIWQVAIVVILILAAAPFCKSRDVARWRESHFAYDNLRAIIQFGGYTGSVLETAYEEPAEVKPQLDPLFQADLNGKPRIEVGRKQQNVLLVVIEGISGAHIEAIRKRHNVDCNVQMPHLSRLCEENLTWTQFVTHNRQTNRGLWALLSGTYDGLTVRTTARMTEYQGREERTLLPHVLRDNGYETVFLQAAPLEFMQKDRFMPAAGFNRVMGDESFANDKRCRLRTRWGPDDRTLFDKATDTVNELAAQEKPWFLTVLTAGTHHPFNLPDDFQGPGEPGSYDRAAAYADLAVGEFMDRLKKSKVLENTLVLITSDESAGLQSYPDELLLNISQNWGFLVAIPPEKPKGMIDELAMQSDATLSILDYLGLTSDTYAFGGRSFFRQYESRRPIFVANHYFRQVGVYDTTNTLYLCRDDWWEGRKYKINGETLFGAPHQRRPYKNDEIETVRAMAHRTAAPLTYSGPKIYQLAAQSEHAIPDSSPRTLLFGGQYLSLRPHTVVKVDLDMEVAADANVIVDLEHRLMPHRPSSNRLVDYKEAVIDSEYVDSISKLKPYLTRRTPCFANGGRFRLSYYYYNVSDNSQIVCDFSAVKRTPGACQIKVHDAKLELVPIHCWKGRALTEDLARVVREKYTGSSWKNLQTLCSSGTLDLRDSWVDDDWLRNVGKLVELRELKLDGSNITDAGLKHLTSLVNLHTISLNDTKVSDQGLEVLHVLPNLTTVSAKNTRVTDAGLKLLSRARPTTLSNHF